MGQIELHLTATAGSRAEAETALESAVQEFRDCSARLFTASMGARSKG
jgi:hypothetical protein